MAPETSAGSCRLHLTLYPSGSGVAWLTQALPTPNGPRARYVSRWSFVAPATILQDPAAALQVALEAFPGI
jgi:hypothetical protein